MLQAPPAPKPISVPPRASAKAIAQDATPEPMPAPQRGPFSRVLHGAAGVVFVGLGVIGAFLPVMPTTVFLLLASWCLARSHPWLEAKLLRNRVVAPYMRYVDGREPMPLRAKVISIAMVVGFSGLSVVMMLRGDAPAWAIAALAILAGVGVWFIARHGRGAGAKAAKTR